MSYPKDNLGDYSKVVEDLKNFGGDILKLYEHIGDTAVEKKRPYIMMEGGVIVLAIAGSIKLCKLCYDSYKKRKSLIKNEPALKEKFVREMQIINNNSSEDATAKGDKDEQEF